MREAVLNPTSLTSTPDTEMPHLFQGRTLASQSTMPRSMVTTFQATKFQATEMRVLRVSEIAPNTFFFSFLSKHLFVLLAQMSEGRCKKKKKCAFLGVVSDVGPLLCCLLEV